LRFKRTDSRNESLFFFPAIDWSASTAIPMSAPQDPQFARVPAVCPAGSPERSSRSRVRAPSASVAYPLCTNQSCATLSDKIAASIGHEQPFPLFPRANPVRAYVLSRSSSTRSLQTRLSIGWPRKTPRSAPRLLSVADESGFSLRGRGRLPPGPMARVSICRRVKTGIAYGPARFFPFPSRRLACLSPVAAGASRSIRIRPFCLLPPVPELRPPLEIAAALSSFPLPDPPTPHSSPKPRICSPMQWARRARGAGRRSPAGNPGAARPRGKGCSCACRERFHAPRPPGSISGSC